MRACVHVCVGPCGESLVFLSRPRRHVQCLRVIEAENEKPRLLLRRKKKKILRPAFCCLQNLSSQLSVFFPLLYHSLHSCFFKWNKTWEEPGRAPASMAGARSSRSDRHRSFRSLLSLQVVCSTPQCSHYAEDANRFMRYDLVSGL